ncbi:hypothetical protein AB7X34_15765 [Proteus mirabilis]|nr:hypothetical protein [Proteus mirabilis]MBW9446046.1 hypothetical protein [Enterobacter sp. EC_50]QIB32091.1 hypothetical protein G3A48_05195 [Providencia stuartii]HDC4435723.1 hypothetical protein [Klebsiella quasipneumoniae]MBQ0522368.1 hypothetical protein [Proteus mirabilis]
MAKAATTIANFAVTKPCLFYFWE